MADDGRIPGRSIRVPDDLWAKAQQACEWRGDSSLSAVIRRHLTAYVRATEKKKQEQDA